MRHSLKYDSRVWIGLKALFADFNIYKPTDGVRDGTTNGVLGRGVTRC